jgi:hypothetical protein
LETLGETMKTTLNPLLNPLMLLTAQPLSAMDAGLAVADAFAAAHGEWRA